MLLKRENHEPSTYGCSSVPLTCQTTAPCTLHHQSRSRLYNATSAITSIIRDDSKSSIVVLSIGPDGVPLMSQAGFETCVYSLTEPTRLPFTRFVDFTFSQTAGAAFRPEPLHFFVLGSRPPGYFVAA